MPEQSAFQRGEIKRILLQLLKQTPAASHELLHAIRSQPIGDTPLGPAEVYPALASLEAAGYIESSQPSGDIEDYKPFQLTESGRRFLDDDQAPLNDSPPPSFMAAQLHTPNKAIAEALQTTLRKLSQSLQTDTVEQLSPATLTKITALLQQTHTQITETIHRSNIAS